MLAQFFQRFPERLRGKQRVARAVLGLLLDRSAPVAVNGRHGIRYQLPNLVENVGFDIFINGVVEGETIAFIAQHLNARAEPVFLDLGANIGGICLPVATLCPTAAVYCVEASPRVFDYLQRNVVGNPHISKKVHVTHAALSNSTEATLDFYSPDDAYGKGSLSAVFTKQATRVNALSLDQFVRNNQISKVDLIKIDVEGYEAQVFASGEHLLSAPDAPDIVFEYCDWAEKLANNSISASQQILQRFGYRICRMDDPRLELKAPLTEGFAMLFATKRPSS